MNILYITRGDHIDYQNDCLLIGLKELYGSKVVDVNKQHHIYTNYEDDTLKLYGRGMTVTKIHNDEIVDRSNISTKIKNRDFDIIIYGSIWRCIADIDKVLEYYPPNRVLVIDGEDETNIHPIVDRGVLYFKRELIDSHIRENILPISFAIPTSKISFNKHKSRDFAYITPDDTSTYIYNREEDYYNDYNISRFGITHKKAGWDCMRHYEMLANGCIPIFKNLNNCPYHTMTTFPKDIIYEVYKNIKSGANPSVVYNKYIDKLENHFISNNTTEALAIGVIKSWQKHQQNY